MDARRIIDSLRRGQTPDEASLRWFAAGLASGRVSDAQAGAFAMAACINGLGDAGRVALTRAMRDSGDTLSWDLPGPVLDKHSTGGVGDPVSLVLAPALAALGCYVPMISGRGLGHTGGTLDKLEAIPGLNTDLSEDRFRDILAETGCAIVSATARIAPADRRLYAIRDMTATVDHVDLITASILSKKLAAGIEALVLDVKVGSGAFMKSMADADALARALVATARGAGCPTAALITDMGQPLTPSIGNALEIADVIAVLKGGDPGGPLAAVSCALGGVLLRLAGLAGSAEDGTARLREALADGRAAERFARMVAAMGGPRDILEGGENALALAPVRRDVPAPSGGVVAGIDGTALGMAVLRLGGGRMQAGDSIVPSVGLAHVVRIGDRVAAGTPLAQIHAETEADAAIAARVVARAIQLSDSPVAPVSLIHERLE